MYENSPYTLEKYRLPPIFAFASRTRNVKMTYKMHLIRAWYSAHSHSLQEEYTSQQPTIKRSFRGWRSHSRSINQQQQQQLLQRQRHCSWMLYWSVGHVLIPVFPVCEDAYRRRWNNKLFGNRPSQCSCLCIVFVPQRLTVSSLASALGCLWHAAYALQWHLKAAADSATVFNHH
jgi:hypothetical protein